MKTRRKPFQKGIVHFKQWSGKGYAVMQSLGKQIRIAPLAMTYSMLVMAPKAEAQSDTNDLNRIRELEEVVVEEEMLVDDQIGLNAIDVITAQQIDYSSSPGYGELLENATGVDVRQRGTFDVQSDLSLRGGSFDQSLVLLNKMNLTDPQTGHYSLNLPIFPFLIDQIDVLRGNAAGVQSASGLTGVANFVVEPEDSNYLALRSEAGTYGLFRSDVKLNGKWGGSQHLLGASYARSDGYLPNSDFNSSKFFYMGQKAFNSYQIKWLAGYQDKKMGANQFYSARFPDQYDENRSFLSGLKIQKKGVFRMDHAVYWRRHWDRFLLFRDDPDLYENHHRSDMLEGDFNFYYPFWKGQFQMASSIRYEEILSNNLGVSLSQPVDVPGYEGDQYTKYFNRVHWKQLFAYEFNLGRWEWSNAITLAGMEKSGHSGWYPSSELTYRLSSYWKVFTAWRQTYRTPTFTDLFYEDPDNIGNPELKPEKAEVYEIGAGYKNDHLLTELTLFNRHTRDVIDWIRRDSVWHTENLTALNTRGIEWRGRWSLSGNQNAWFAFQQLDLSYTYYDMVKDDQGLVSNYALDHLRHHLRLGLKWSVLDQFVFTANTSYQHRNGSYSLYNSSDGLYTEHEYEPVWLLDARVEYHWNDWRIFMMVNNLLDQTYFDYGNVYQPGRWTRAGIRYDLPL